MVAKKKAKKKIVSKPKKKAAPKKAAKTVEKPKPKKKATGKKALLTMKNIHMFSCISRSDHLQVISVDKDGIKTEKNIPDKEKGFDIVVK